MSAIKPEQYSKQDLNRFLSQLIGDVADKDRIDALTTSVHAFYVEPLLREVDSSTPPLFKWTALLLEKMKAFLKPACK